MENNAHAQKHVLITGGNRGIGKAIAQKLLEQGHHVLITCRDKSTGTQVVQELKDLTNNSAISVAVGDLSSIKSTYKLAKLVKERDPKINVLINNAGVWMTKRELTDDGLERSFMVNYLATFILCKELFPLLKENKPARIVNVNAGLYVKGAFDRAKTPKGLDFHAIKTYANSKLCGVLFAQDFAEEIKGSGVSLNSVHPGVIKTGLGDSPQLLSRLIKFMKRFWKSPEYGAEAPVWLAISEEVEGVSGNYYNEKEIMEYPDRVKDVQLRAYLQDETKKILQN